MHRETELSNADLAPTRTMSKCGTEATGLLQTDLLTILRKVLVSPPADSSNRVYTVSHIAIRGFPFYKHIPNLLFSRKK